MVKHFAGDVVYNCNEFLEKNNDSLTKEFEEELLKSKKPLTVKICTPEETAAPAKGKKGGGGFSSVGLKFIASLKQLMTELRASEAHFVRCIKSNPELKPQVRPRPAAAAPRPFFQQHTRHGWERCVYRVSGAPSPSCPPGD